MQGASALETMLERMPGAPVKAFVVWEPVLRTDHELTDEVRAKVTDPRAVQYWDPQRLVSKRLKEGGAKAERHSGKGPVWDAIAVYPADAVDLAKPAYIDGDVIEVVPQAEAQVRQALARR